MNDKSIEKILAQIIPILPGHLWFMDANGIYKICSASQAFLFGLDQPSDVMGHTNTTLPLLKKNPDLQKKWINFQQQAIASQKSFHFEILFKTSQKQMIRYQSIPLFDSTRFAGLLGISLQNDNSSLEEVRMLRKILDNLPEHVYWKDSEGFYLGCNLNQARDLNLETSESVIGKTDYDLSSKDKADEFRKIDNIVLTEEKEISAEEIIVKNGEPRVVLSKKIPLYNRANRVIGVLGVSFDITDRKKMEEELRKAKEAAEKAKYMMTEFISNMGHDLATPITDVETVVMMLDEYADEYPELKDILQTLNERAGACEAVRKRILNATSISNLEVKLETFSVIEVILELEKKFRSEIDEKKLKLLIHPLKPKKEDVITADREKFSAILEELLLNAIHFTDEGSISISIIKEKENDIVHIEVTDTGIGIPADKFDYIFEPYTKLAPSNQFGQTFKGPGCGLYLVEVRANILGASINVKSELGKGSTFTLSIPVHPKK